MHRGCAGRCAARTARPLAATLLAAALAAGCVPTYPGRILPRPELEEPNLLDRRLTLVEVGERSLDYAERLEEAGRTREAREAYERAAAAFRQHENLTGETPLLLEDARQNAARLRAAEATR